MRAAGYYADGAENLLKGTVNSRRGGRALA